MRWARILGRRLRSLLGGSHEESDLRREIQLHLDQLVKESIAAGMSEADAVMAARRQFGAIEVTKEQCRDMRRVHVIEDLIRDVTYAVRWLWKSPGFTLTAVLSLALGIGANIVVFSVLNALLLKPLPISDPSRVYFIDNSGQQSNSFPNYREIRDRNSVFESLFGYRIGLMAFGDPGGAHSIGGYLVTGNYFDALGIRPALGRFFTPAADGAPNASPYAVLSDACWRARFAGDPGIVGRQILINAHPYTVVGVAQPGFHGTEVFFWPEVWVPMAMQPQIEGSSWLDDPNTYNVWIAGRLKAGVSVGQADANLGAIAAQLARERGANDVMRLTLSPLGMGGSFVREPTRAFVGGVLLLAALVLLAACTNLAALLTARTADRERELAIRVSIGAGRGRLVRQLLTESLSLSVAGAAVSYGIAIVFLRMLSRVRAPFELPMHVDVRPDWRVLVFAIAAALGTAALFGLGPIFRAQRGKPVLGAKGWAGPRRRFGPARDLLLPIEIALCCALVISSLVAVRGLTRALRLPLGLEPDGVALVGYSVGLAGYDTTRGRLFEQRVLETVSGLPGVDAAAYTDSVPLGLDKSSTLVSAETASPPSGRRGYEVPYYDVSPGYFGVAGTRLLAGRVFRRQIGHGRAGWPS